MKKSIFITGAEGFIGSHLVEKLIDEKYQVYALVLYNSFGDIGNLKFLPKEKLKKTKIIFGDLKDPGTYEDYIKKSNHVVNLASLISIPYSYVSKKSYLQNNIIGSSELFNLCVKHKIKKVIHFSTSEIYGTPKKIPIDENSKLNPQSPYAASKLAVDHLAKSYFYSYDMPLIILRPFNNFGPRQSRRAVIPEIICQMLKSNKIYLGDISTKRDFLFVEDTVSAALKILKKKKIYGQEFNIGSDNFYKISEVVNMLKSIINKKIEIKLDPKKIRPRKSEVKVLLCNSNKAKKILNWKPSCSSKKDFYNKLKYTVEHYKKHLNLYENLNLK